MIARPTTAALSCRSCQHALFRAVLSTHNSTVAPRSTLRALAPTPRSLLPRRRFYSIERSPAASKAPADIQPTEEELTEEQLAENETQDIEKDSGTPWFLEVEAPRHPASQHAVTLPKAPENAPELLEPLIKYVYEDMGLDELALL